MATNLAPGVVPAIGALAQSDGVREALHWFTREKQWINEQHLELCRIPSPTFLAVSYTHLTLPTNREV